VLRLPEYLRKNRKELASRLSDPRLLGAVRNWTWNSPNVLLCGATKCGKSAALAIACLNIIREPGKRWRHLAGLRWVQSGELAEAMREHRLGYPVPEIVRKTKTARVLVLDDIGNGDLYQPYIDELFNILQYRYSKDLATLSSSNLSPQDLCRGFFSEQIMRRLHERRGIQGHIVAV
jgi:DNA replication protein DnaC